MIVLSIFTILGNSGSKKGNGKSILNIFELQGGERFSCVVVFVCFCFLFFLALSFAPKCLCVCVFFSVLFCFLLFAVLFFFMGGYTMCTNPHPSPPLIEAHQMYHASFSFRY